jgi:hypothetical protein
MKKIAAGEMALGAFLDGVLSQRADLIARGARGPLAVPGALRWSLGHDLRAGGSVEPEAASCAGHASEC